MTLRSSSSVLFTKYIEYTDSEVEQRAHGNTWNSYLDMFHLNYLSSTNFFPVVITKYNVFMFEP